LLELTDVEYRDVERRVSVRRERRPHCHCARGALPSAEGS
jgi:hypothetical protein